MYTEYFGLAEKPFNITPDPRFFYSNASYREAEAQIIDGISERQGFVVLTGEVGIGKTTLLRRLMNRLESTVRCAYFYNTRLSFDELLVFACEDFGLRVGDRNRVETIRALNDLLVERAQAGETAALFIDEAQNLEPGVLEELRLLSNLETAQQRLLQIVLVGQPELEEKLDRPDLRQVKQRIAVRAQLKRLADSEVGDFIQFRLDTAGCERKDIFSPEAIAWIAHYSQGLPRLINTICDNALSNCCRLSQETVTPNVIQEVALYLKLDNARKAPEFQLREALGEVTQREFNRRNRHTWTRRIAVGGVLLLANIGAFAYITNPSQFKARISQESRRIERLINVLREDPASFSDSAPAVNSKKTSAQR